MESLAAVPALALGNPVQWRPRSIARPCHFRPDGTAGVNADRGLTLPPDYPTASQTRARSVPERLWLHAALAISPSTATAGP